MAGVVAGQQGRQISDASGKGHDPIAHQRAAKKLRPESLPVVAGRTSTDGGIGESAITRSRR